MQVSRPSVRPVPQAPSHRFQSTTPMPHVRRTNTFRPIASSPPPFEAPSPNVRLSHADDIFAAQPQLQQPTNISLLSRGISLLSITQLRNLMRDYSLPTGGNKHVLVNRLIIFLETFGQNQQNILSAFSSKLKRLLSVEADESPSSPTMEEISQSQMSITQSIPQDIAQNIFASSPSSLYEPVDIQPSYGPIMIQPNFGNTPFNFAITSPSIVAVPILQFSPSYVGGMISRVVIQINGVFLNLRAPGLWSDMKNFIDRPGSFQIISVDPAVPVIATIRWMRPVPIQQLVSSIAMKEMAPKMPLSGPNVPNGVCPLTRKIIVRPARGSTCMHAECFDLSGFICSSIKSNSWQCPICRKPLTVEDLRIDPNFFAIASGVLL